MPIYDYRCPRCGHAFEELVLGDQAPPCPSCGETGVERQVSASSTLSGRAPQATPGATGHGCCGSRPGDKGCVPGSCCGKA